MRKNKNLLSVIIEGSSIKIKNSSLESIKIPLQSITEIYLNFEKPSIYAWGLSFIFLGILSTILFFVFGYLIAISIFLVLFLFFYNKYLKHKIYYLCIEFNDKNYYTVKIPNKLKQEIKDLIWQVRGFKLKNGEA